MTKDLLHEGKLCLALVCFQMSATQTHNVQALCLTRGAGVLRRAGRDGTEWKGADLGDGLPGFESLFSTY